MKKSTCYGKVVLYIPQHKPRKRKNAIASVSYYTTFYKPALLVGLDTFLAYEGDVFYYEVYNPLRIEFVLQDLVSLITKYHRHKMTQVVGNFRVVSISDRKVKNE